MELRLNRFLAQAGVSSRRGADELVREGRVTVNGVVVTGLGHRVDPDVDRVTVDGREVRPAERIFWGALHKPAGVITTLEDPFGHPDLRALIAGIPARVFPVGRLDEDSEGLLLVTNDGDLCYRLTHPRYAIEKEYQVEVTGAVPPDLVARLTAGVELDDGPARAVHVEVAAIAADTRHASVVHITLTEGRNREVRRMLGAVGLGVRRLVRVRVGSVQMGDLAPGAWRELTASEVGSLRHLAGLAR